MRIKGCCVPSTSTRVQAASGFCWMDGLTFFLSNTVSWMGKTFSGSTVYYVLHLLTGACRTSVLLHVKVQVSGTVCSVIYYCLRTVDAYYR